MGITVSLSTSCGVETSSSSQSFNLDRSTWLQQGISLNSGKISSNLHAEGEGKNILSQSLSGNGYALKGDVNSQGMLSVSTSSSASGQSGSISQDVAGAGCLSLSLQGEQASASVGQEASVAYGLLSSSQSLSAGEGQGALAWQSTTIAGEAGRVGSQAYTSDSLMLAEGTFSGRSSLDADLSAGASGDSKVDGNIAVNGATWLDGATLQTIQAENLGMSLQGLQATSDERIGSFSVRAVNMDATAIAQAAQSSGEATSLNSQSGGSSTSYILAKNSAGYPYRWNEAAPKVQLYLKSDTVPSNLDPAEVKYAISAAANTWDNAVAKNLFADGQTVISDPSKGIDQRDGFNVNAWKYLSDAPRALAYSRTWSGGPIVGGYYSALESDISYNSRWTWSTSGGDYDVQSVAVHELGHTIGLGDIYSTTYGGTLPPTDPRTQDFEQVMNAYDAPQRTLGNGDRTGAQLLYGVSNFKQSEIGVLRNSAWYLDNSGNGVWDAGDTWSYFGISGDLPVVGDWNGDGKDKIGVLRNGAWYFDINGNGVWDAGDTWSYFGISGDLPVAGDWNIDGKDEIGVLRNGAWYFDINGNGVWDAGDKWSYFGISGDLPVVGDWNGDGKDKIGVLRNGAWYFDNSGNGIWDAGDTWSYFGISGDLPVAGDWNGDGKDMIGVLRNGAWYLDNSGNRVWD
ncbi:MAG: hypothetical protein M0Q43_09600, partial [Methanothrix sp.]|nr:hypothetical protein [Methanothrix sp.]